MPARSEVGLRVHVGASGFSYPAWKPRFYPEKLPQRRFLQYYASRLDTVEINATFYGMPAEETLVSWREQAGTGFVFALKAPQRITHRWRLRGESAELAGRLCELAERILGPTRGPMLFQLPPSFRRDLPRLEAFLAALPEDHRAALEFRHESWFDDAVYASLRARGAALCIADTPELRTPWVPTADVGYIRLRQPDYSADALRAWRSAILSAPWREAYVYFKHDEGARAPARAEAFRDQLAAAA